jgi:hypothetical protein
VVSESLQVLLIQSWVVPGADVRSLLRGGRYTPQIYRVDFESALVAALMRGGYDVVLLDVASSGIRRATVESSMLEHRGHLLPLVELVPGQDLGSAVRIALSALRN